MKRSLFPRISSPTALLYTFVVITQIGRGMYVTSRNDPSAAFALLDALGFLWILSWWLLRDSRKRGIAQVFDIGMFLYVAWPLLMPYYLLKSRRAKGLLVILGFISVYIGAGVVGVVLYVLLTPSASAWLTSPVIWFCNANS